jgi:hypothetical protein
MKLRRTIRRWRYGSEFPRTPSKFQVEALFDKLDATSRAETVHKGLKRGLIDL